MATRTCGAADTRPSRARIAALAVVAVLLSGAVLVLALRAERETASGVVYVPQLGADPAVRPRYVASAATNPGFVIKRWRRYGGETAVADAEYSSNDCTPSCVGGKRTISRNVLVLSSIGGCDGRRAYLSAKVRDSDDQDMEGVSIDLRRYCRERAGDF